MHAQAIRVGLPGKFYAGSITMRRYLTSNWCGVRRSENRPEKLYLYKVMV